MNKRLQKLGTFISLTVLSASISVGLSGCPETTTDNNGQIETVEIDANLPLTGNLAIFGKAIQDGATFALEDLAKNNTSKLTLKFDWQDNEGLTKTALGLFQNQFLKEPDVYITGLKPQTDAVKAKVIAEGTPHFVWTFDAFINQNSNNKFRTWLNFKIEAPMYLRFIQENQAQKVAILYVKLPNTEEQFTKLVIPSLEEQGIEFFVESYDLQSNDFKNIAAKVKNFDPDVILLNGFPKNLVAIVRAFRPLNLIKDGNTMGSFDMIDAATILEQEEKEGITVAAPLFILSPDEKVVEWNQRFEEKFERPPLYTDAFSYDMVQIIYDAAKRLQNPATAPSDRWIEALRATNIEGITGLLKFDQDGDLAVPIDLGIYRNNLLVPEPLVKKESVE